MMSLLPLYIAWGIGWLDDVRYEEDMYCEEEGKMVECIGGCDCDKSFSCKKREKSKSGG